MLFGVGINNGDRKSRNNGRKLPHYVFWQNMMSRCYNPDVSNEHKTYENCFASDNFKNYAYFYDWCERQKGFNEKGFQLDKDLVFKGNKEYSEDKCFFVPKRINTLILNRDNDRGNLPIGVHYNRKNNKYIARISNVGNRIHLGSFDNPIDAFFAYKKAKEELIRLCAIEFKCNIHPMVYNSLVNYEVDILD